MSMFKNLIKVARFGCLLFLRSTRTRTHESEKDTRNEKL